MGPGHQLAHRGSLELTRDRTPVPQGPQQPRGCEVTSLSPGSFTQFTSGLAPQGVIEGPILAQAAGTWYLWGDANALFYTWQTSDLSTGTWTATDRRV
ncbi:hypothetical protein OHS71_01215 [Streptomyces sp. NBC_00377]|uniref:hypothetical protein n=1 Tax=unclassified Streptomyces TaxID=2593676 RepID=UPI002E2102E7|nr:MULTISPECIES: hypothetical protein [unclassified Streptomyces]